MPRNPTKQRCTATNRDGSRCRSWALRDGCGLCASHAGRIANAGPPKGSRNALKHGFYSRQFESIEIADLQVVTASLEDEIAGLRVAGRRMLEHTSQIENPTAAVQALNHYGNQMMRVARMLQIKSQLANTKSDVAATIFQAITEVLKEKRLL